MMVRTAYGVLSTAELLQMTLMRDNRSELEVELAQRLEFAIGFLDQVDQAHMQHQQSLLDGTNS